VSEYDEVSDGVFIGRCINEVVETLDEMQMPELRDRFAMAALTGLLAHYGDGLGRSDAAAKAYAYADLMQQEKQKK
jgi:hypothetical protein